MKKADYFLAEKHNSSESAGNFIANDEVGLCITDFYTRKILVANRKMALYAGKSDTSMIGEYCLADMEPDKKNRCPFCRRKNLIDWNENPMDPHIQEMYLESANVWLKVTNQTVSLPDGNWIHIVTFHDITEAKRLREQLTDSLFRDKLLGMKNDIRLEQDLREAAEKPSLILLEMMSLRKINESYGRRAGDCLLRYIRDRILSQNVPDSELYRIGGDKFCLAVANISRNVAKVLAEKLSLLFAEPWIFEHEGEKVWASCTASISVIPGRCIKKKEPPSSIIDRMLERAKKSKRVVLYDEKVDKVHKDKIALEWSLQRCVHENMRGFDIRYQPVVDSVSGIWCGLEALCRWNSPELGAISPIVFIPEAERLQLIGTLGLWVLENAVRKCKEWELDKCDTFRLGINLSAAQFSDEFLSAEIIEIIRKYNYPGERLCIEITESTDFTFLDKALNTVEQLRASDVVVALDDFGTGYSGFNRLKNMPVDIVKIERVFIANIEKDEYQRYLFHAMAELAHAAEMKLIAEGVERRSQMDILKKDGADYLQGYLFGKPLSPEDLENNLGRFYEQPSAMLPSAYFAEKNEVQKAVV